MVEIEKKYRLTKSQRDMILQKLSQIGATLCGEEFEENTIYAGESLDPTRKALRLRRVGGKALLTYKERYPTKSSVKHQREEETEVTNADAMNTILELLGYSPAIVYEKRRQTWCIGNNELVLDELPFGFYMEIEGSEEEIDLVEQRLALSDLTAEGDTYPELTLKHGDRRGRIIEARFETNRGDSQVG